ncbi:MAG: ferritin family protein [bacterium]|nr:ferritin family protein [bacterium]
MNIVEFAMQMERDGQLFYEKAAAAAPQPEMKEIFLYLAREEERHFAFFKSMHEGDTQAAIKVLAGNSMAETKNVFVHLIEENGDTTFGDDARQAWAEALKIEEKAVKLYSEEAEKEKSPERKDLLQRIAEEERTHVYLIDNMLSFMSDPQTFADSQNYKNFKSWEGR